MEEIIGQKPVDTLTVLTKEVASGKFEKKVQEFADRMV
jgi:hypothetical protein